ncbi:MAG: hypothetical protein B7Z57_11640 [Acidiphilium sp. 37-60-79]|nr:MAG: hypothetical protein B7Z57_11640 [Acidiphilium sp. 37-60-79]OZB40867.1 MAG: hypothetical protein B7X48_03310 [Acidiphilium sp. 34-60-192]
MPQDMVASVTLMLRDQMGAGIDEIKAQLAGLKPTLDSLTGVITELDATLQQLRMPMALNAGLKATAKEAAVAAKEVTAVADAAMEVNAGLKETASDAAAAAREVTAMADAAVEANARMKELAIPPVPNYTQYNPPIPQEFYGPMQPGMGPAGGPRARQWGPNDIGSTAEPGPMDAGVHAPDPISDFIATAIMGAIGVESVKSRAEFNNLNLHSAITEHLHGHAARVRMRWINNDLDRLALKYRQSSDELSDAYYYLVTTHMKPALINALMPMIAKTATAYNSSPKLMGAAAFAMSDSFKIPTAQMPAALAAMAWAAKNSHFSIESMGEFLPMLGGNAATLGMTGRKNLDQIMAAVETIRKNVNQPQEAAHDLADLMNSLSSIHTAEAFSQNLFKRALKTEQPLLTKYHIKPVNLWAIEQAGVKKGESPLMAVMNYLHKMLMPMNPVDRSAFINAMFSGQGSSMAVKSMLLHWPTMNKLIAGLNTVDQQMLNTDFKTAMSGSASVVRKFNESLAQLNRGIGHTVLPAMKVFANSLGWIEQMEHPKIPAKMSPKKQANMLDGNELSGNPLPHLLKSLVSALHDNTRAARSTQLAISQGEGIGAHVNAHPTSPAGPVLHRP